MEGFSSALHIQNNNSWREAGTPQVVNNNAIQHPVRSQQQNATSEVVGQVNGGNASMAMHPLKRIQPTAGLATPVAQSDQHPWYRPGQATQPGYTAKSMSAPQATHPHPMHPPIGHTPHGMASHTASVGGQHPTQVSQSLQQGCQQRQQHQAQMGVHHQVSMVQQGVPRRDVSMLPVASGVGTHVSASYAAQHVNPQAHNYRHYAAAPPVGHHATSAAARSSSAPAALPTHSMPIYTPALSAVRHGSTSVHQPCTHVAAHQGNMMQGNPAARPQNFSAPNPVPSAGMQMACTDSAQCHQQLYPAAPYSALNMLPARHSGALLPPNGATAAQHAHPMSQHSQYSQMMHPSQHSIDIQPTSERPHDTCPGVFKHCGGNLQLVRMRDGPDMWTCQVCGHMFCGVDQKNDVKLALELTEVHVHEPVGQADGAVDRGIAGIGAEIIQGGGAQHPSTVSASADTAQCRGKVVNGSASYADDHKPARKEVQVVVKPLAQSRRALRFEGGLLQAISLRQRRPVTSALQSSAEEAVFHLDSLPRLREVLKDCKLLDTEQSDIPDWIEKSFRRQVPRTSQYDVDDALSRMPETLKQGLLAFQWEGVRFGLLRNTRCLIGDEMGVGKTVQAIALAACHMHEWSPLLVICPASLRLLWCEELEKWLPGVRPCDITIVQGSADWHPDQMESAFTHTEAAPSEAENNGGTANAEKDIDHPSQNPGQTKANGGPHSGLHNSQQISHHQSQRRLQPAAVHQDARSDRDKQPTAGEGSHKVPAEDNCTVDRSVLDKQQDTCALHTGGLVLGDCAPESQGPPQRHDSQCNSDQKHADTTQDDHAPQSQHNDEGGSTDQCKSPKVIIISYHMAANLSCAACKRPSSGGQNHKPSSAKAGSAKGPQMCPGFPHCVAAGVYPFVIVDESHHMRTQSGQYDSFNTEVAKQIVQKSGRAVLLSGTPSVTRPFDLAGQLYCLQPSLLGTAGSFPEFKTAFANRYCQRCLVHARRPGGAVGPKYWWQAGAERLGELASVLRRDFMIRRLKTDVLPQLPAKRRQVLRLEQPTCKDMEEAEKAALQAWQDEQKEEQTMLESDGAFQLPVASGEDEENGNDDGEISDEGVSDSEWQPNAKGAKHKNIFRMRGEPRTSEEDHRPVTTPQHILGLAKVRQVKEFLSIMMLSTPAETQSSQGSQQTTMPAAPCNSPSHGTLQKFVLFAHHKSVMNLLQVMLEEHFQKNNPSSTSKVPYVRIDGTTDHKSRQELQRRFHEDSSCNVALLSMNATAVGLDFSCATAVVFTEVPDTADILLQAEGRAHRMTSKSAVNVYVLLCKGTRDVRTWCRLAESLERQAPLLDSGRKSVVPTAPEENDPGAAAHSDGVASDGAGQPSGMGIKREDVQADVRAAKAVARADASGRNGWHGDAERGKKALHVDAVMDLSEALQMQRDAKLAPSNDNPITTDAHCPESNLDFCAVAQNTDEQGDSHIKGFPTVSDCMNGAAVGTHPDAVAEACNGSRAQQDGIVIPDTDDDSSGDDLGGHDDASNICPAQHGRSCLDQSISPTGEVQDVQGHISTCCSWKAPNTATMQLECPPQEKEPPAADVAASQPALPQQRATAALDSAAAGGNITATKQSSAVVHRGIGADMVAVDVAKAAVFGVSNDDTAAKTLVAAEKVATDDVQQRDKGPPATDSLVMNRKHDEDAQARRLPADSEMHTEGEPQHGGDIPKHSSMSDDLRDWVDEPLYDTCSGEDHKEDSDDEMRGISEQLDNQQPADATVEQQIADGDTLIAPEQNGESDFDASSVFFMVNQHTENVTLLLGQDGETPLGLRLPLSALQPKTTGANEKHVEHLYSMLQEITKPSGNKAPVVRLPWGGMMCPSIQLSAAALTSILQRAVMFGVAWGALSAMQKHQMGSGVLDVGEATGVSFVHGFDLRGGASQQEAEESFLRSIDKRNVRLKLDPSKGEHWRPVSVTVPTSNGAKRMAFDQPFTCKNPKYNCISEQQWCCEGKRHCCNCKKLLSRSEKPTGTAGSGSASKPKSAGSGGKAKSAKAQGPQIKDGGGTKRPQKRIFIDLAAAGDPDDGSKPGSAALNADGSLDAADGMRGQASSSGVGQAAEKEANLEDEDVASMLLLFCSPRCQNDYMLLKSNSAIRRQLFAIERGRCQECHLDTEGLLSRLRCLPGNFGGIERRQKMIFDTAPLWNKNQKRRDAARRLARHPVPGNAWQADHIKAVHLGGGLCDITNFRTLCTCCHADVTAKQAKDRAKHTDAGNTRSIPDIFQAVRDSDAKIVKDWVSKPPRPKKRRQKLKESKIIAEYLAAKESSLRK